MEFLFDMGVFFFGPLGSVCVSLKLCGSFWLSFKLVNQMHTQMAVRATALVRAALGQLAQEPPQQQELR